MAKINHNNPFTTINDFMVHAKESNAIHHYAQDNQFDKGFITIQGVKCLHFATTGYLGLEQDVRLKQAAAAAVFKYGTQFPLSKTYISHPLYTDLEHRLYQMYQQEGFICKNSTLAHLGVIPQAVSNDDVVILDHQVHWSVHNACQLLKNRGIPIHMIRHNDCDHLESLLLKYQSTANKIWYFADGIYSMYGDHAPMDTLQLLFNKYEKLHLYFDDVHGMSWIGQKGTGFVFHYFKCIPKRMIMVTTLSKTFGASGAYVICGDRKLHQQIKNYGGPLTFSAQLEPTAVAAAVASADIHLSEEIYTLQKELRMKVECMNQWIQSSELPLISKNDTPVFFVGTATPQTAYWLVDKLVKEGYFINPGIYPAVPMKNAGLRITISNHNQMEHIQSLVEVLSFYFPKALEATHNDLYTINKVFKLDQTSHSTTSCEPKKYTCKIYKSLQDINPKLWNDHLAIDHAFDYDGMLWIEEMLSNREVHDPLFSKFKYYLIYDTFNTCVGIIPIVEGQWKLDMLSSEKVSKKIEKKREDDAMFLTEWVWSTASIFSEGKHVYIKDDDPHLWNYALEIIGNDFYNSKATKLIIRDCMPDVNHEKLFSNKGFVSIDMPDSAEIRIQESFVSKGVDSVESKKKRRTIKTEILAFTNDFYYECTSKATPDELSSMYEQYLNVHRNNLSINTFPYDLKTIEKMNDSEQWKFIKVFETKTNQWVSTMFCFYNKHNQSFNPILIGIESNLENRLVVYRQSLFCTLKEAVINNAQIAYLGVSASFEKKKLGATILKKKAYIHSKDNYFDDLLATYE